MSTGTGTVSTVSTVPGTVSCAVSTGTVSTVAGTVSCAVTAAVHGYAVDVKGEEVTRTAAGEL